MEIYDDKKHVEETFNEENLHDYLIQAQWAEFIELKKVISELSKKKGRPLTILDIGIGDGRILKHLVPIDELWKLVSQYDGIDIAQNCIDISTELIKKLGVSSKASVVLLDAENLDKLGKKYDLIITTWFTAGNLYPKDFSFEKFNHDFDLSKNPKFSAIFKQAYDALNPGGEIVIGSMYLDNPSTRKKQEDTYRHFGWDLITDERDDFTATKRGWWSQRFSKQRLFDYIPTVAQENFEFISLDTYDYAAMVRIKKD